MRTMCTSDITVAYGFLFVFYKMHIGLKTTNLSKSATIENWKNYDVESDYKMTMSYVLDYWVAYLFKREDVWLHVRREFATLVLFCAMSKL